jgi:hypothetical protein
MHVQALGDKRKAGVHFHYFYKSIAGNTNTAKQDAKKTPSRNGLGKGRFFQLRSEGEAN